MILDGGSLKAILFAHESAVGLFKLDIGEVTLPAPPVQFLENFDVELTQNGAEYEIHYYPRDPAERDGDYFVALKNSNGAFSVQNARKGPFTATRELIEKSNSQ